MKKSSVLIIGILLTFLTLMSFVGLVYFLWGIPQGWQKQFIGAVENVSGIVERINVGGQLSDGRCLSYQTITDDDSIDEIMDTIIQSRYANKITGELVTTSGHNGTDESELTPQTYRLELYDEKDNQIAEVTFPTSANNGDERCKMELSEPFEGKEEFNFAISDYDKLVDLTIK